MKWDFTVQPARAWIRVILVYPDNNDGDRPYQTTGYRWELPDPHGSAAHGYVHAQPIRTLHLGTGHDPKSRALSEKVPTFWLHPKVDEPDRLIANVLISLYGANQDLLALLTTLEGADRALRGIG